MIKIYALSPGWVFHGSHDRGQEARLYLAWLWHGQAELRLLDCACSILLRPLEWLFPLACIEGRWVRLGGDVKPAALGRRLGLAAPDACVRIAAGRAVFGPADAEPSRAAGIEGPVPTVPCGLLWAKPKPAPDGAGEWRGDER